MGKFLPVDLLNSCLASIMHGRLYPPLHLLVPHSLYSYWTFPEFDSSLRWPAHPQCDTSPCVCIADSAELSCETPVKPTWYQGAPHCNPAGHHMHKYIFIHLYMCLRTAQYLVLNQENGNAAPFCALSLNGCSVTHHFLGGQLSNGPSLARVKSRQSEGPQQDLRHVRGLFC